MTDDSYHCVCPCPECADKEPHPGSIYCGCCHHLPDEPNVFNHLIKPAVSFCYTGSLIETHITTTDNPWDGPMNCTCHPHEEPQVSADLHNMAEMRKKDPYFAKILMNATMGKAIVDRQQRISEQGMAVLHYLGVSHENRKYLRERRNIIIDKLKAMDEKQLRHICLQIMGRCAKIHWDEEGIASDIMVILGEEE